MKKSIVLVFLLGLLMFAQDAKLLGGRGGGGGRVGGGGSVHSYGGSGGATARTTTPIVGAGGGSGQINRGSAAYTTKGGATVDYRGATVGGTTGGGATGVKHVGGVQVTGAGGNTATHVGTSGAVIGPGGNAFAGKSGATVGTGPNASFATKYQGGVAVGPQGAVGGSTRVGAAVSPYGAVAGRSTVVAGRGTYYRPTTAIHAQGVYVNRGVAAYPCFRGNWYTRNPAAWFAAGWTASAVWHAATWPACAAYGYPPVPVYYDYGSNVVYQDDGVYFDGTKAYSAEDYAQQATTLADTGIAAPASKDEEWLPLGVFAMVQGEETTSNNIFQLSINKQGVIRGNYYDAITDSTSQVFGSADKKTMRAAWTVGDRKTPVYEVGIANLTKDETTMLVHYSPERTQQFSLVRIEAPKEEKK